VTPMKLARRNSPLLAAIISLSFAAPAVSRQNTSPAPAQNRAASAPSPTAEITIRGCISGDKRYTFMQASTGAVFDLAGKTARFAPVRGKLIEVTANELAPPENTNQSPRLQVKTLKVVADRCPIQSAPVKTANSPSSNQAPAPAPPGTERYRDPSTETQTPPNVNNPNMTGDTGTPSPGTGNPPSPPQ